VGPCCQIDCPPWTLELKDLELGHGVAHWTDEGRLVKGGGRGGCSWSIDASTTTMEEEEEGSTTISSNYH
jgi:hypothetical protein